MKRIILLIILPVLCVMIVSSCAGYTANAPGEPFSRNDWDVCGFEPWAEREDFESRFVTDGWLCADGVDAETGAFSCWSNSTHFGGGLVGISCNWLLGKEFKRLYTNLDWGVTVTGMAAGVALPRGLTIGCTLKDIERAFGLGEADDQGLYYGDGKNAPYAKIEDLGYDSKKEISLAVPAGETNDEAFNYTCILKLMFDGKDSLTEFRYISLCKYRILPGLPESEQVDEVRVYSAGKEEPESVLKFDEAIDALACIQNAGQTPAAGEVTPTHSIEIISGGEIYTLKYGGGLIEAPNGKVYEIWGIDEEALFGSLPELRPYGGTYMRDERGKAAELSKEQEAEINAILGNIAPCSEIAYSSGNCRILVAYGDGFLDYMYLIGTHHVILKDKLYHMSEEDSNTIERIYRVVFKDIIPGLDTGIGSNTGQSEGGNVPVLREEPLLPGLPSPAVITEVRIWHIGNEGITVIFTPFEAAGLFEVIQAGGGKPLAKLESPTHKILIKSGGGDYELTVGSNGIEAPDGKLYGVTFPEHAAETYLFLEGDVKEIFPSDRIYDRLTVKSDKSGQFCSFGEHKTEAQDIINSMEKCEGTKPGSRYCTISGVIGDTWFKFIYYIGTEYIVYKNELYSISGENAEKLTQIYKEIFGE